MLLIRHHFQKYDRKSVFESFISSSLRWPSFFQFSFYTAEKLNFQSILGQNCSSLHLTAMSVTLVIHCEKAENLLKMDPNGKADPYVKVQIKGKKETRVKTKEVQSTLNPVWDKDLKVVSTTPDTDILQISVVDKDIGRDDEMCDKIEIPVKEFPVGQKQPRVFDLKWRKKAAGKLYLSFEACEGGGP